MRCKARTVYLVGAGPGDPKLITVRGMELLRSADVIVHDRLVSPELIAAARSEAEVIDVGKAPGCHRYSQRWINALIVDRAARGLAVVRLKGGDPFVFGRGFEELAHCRDVGVACEVVPGVSSVVAAPAAAGIPITKRGVSRSVVIITGQTGGDAAASFDYAALATIDTIVMLMARANLAALTGALLAAGRPPTTPAACIESATTSRQRIIIATLATVATVAAKNGLQAPVVTVIGDVAADAEQSEALARQALSSQPAKTQRAG